MADLVVLVPSRGRPGNVARLIEACAATCRADTRLWFGFDDNDPQLGANRAAAQAAQLRTGVATRYTIGPRHGLAVWTNDLASMALRWFPDAVALCSLGDDHVPETDGWDEQLLGALAKMGGGWAYPWDGRRDDIAEAVAVSTSIMRDLGWMALPKLHHWCIDNAWTTLAKAVGRLEYLEHVRVPHRHPHNPIASLRVVPDATYEEARWSYDLDKRRYLHWRDQGGLAADAAKVREILGIEAPEDEAAEATARAWRFGE